MLLARKRVLRMLLLPILAPLFLLGWMLAYFGKKNLMARNQARHPPKAAEDEALKFGLLNEINEESSLLENYPKRDKA